MYPKKKFDGGSRFGGKRDFGGPSQLYPATCVQCGNECQVPFRPTGNRPVFCRDCFKNQGEGNMGGSNMGGPKKWESREDSRGDSRGDSRSFGDDRLMYPAECDTCGNECKVPFKPTQGRPVYCHRCMAAQNNTGAPSSFAPARPSFTPSNSFAPARPAFAPAAPSSKMSEEQFKVLNTKMDKILKILELATGDIDMDDEEDEEFEELEDIKPVKAAKAPKAVKAAKAVKEVEEAPKKKPTRGQVKRAKRTGKTL